MRDLEEAKWGKAYDVAQVASRTVQLRIDRLIV